MTASAHAPEVEPDPAAERVDPPPWRGRFALYAVGVVLMAVGIRLVLRNLHTWTPPVDVGEWLVAGIVLHDGVLAPVTIVVALVLRRALPWPWRGPVVAGLVVSGVLVLAALPQIFGRKFATDNPTIQPRDYGRGLLIALAVVWAVVLLLEVVLIVRHRRAVPAAAPAPAVGDHPGDAVPADDVAEPPAAAEEEEDG